MPFKLPRWFVVLAFIVAMPTLILACAKAEVPYCERYTVKMYETEEGPVFVLDVANLKKLAALIQGVTDGTCKLDNRPSGKNV